MTEVINTFVFPIVRQDHVLTALHTLRQFTPANYRTIVVNQSVYNEAFERNLWEAADVVIRTKLNYGFAQAVNLGTRLAPTEWVTVCNDDCEFFNAQWWPGIMETFERFPKALGVCPFSPKEPGWGWGEEGYRMHAELDECQADPAGVVERLKKKWDGAVIDGFPTWLVVFKRKEWMELGMFDERFTPGSGEDYDALARAYQAGYRMLASSYSFVWHHWGQSKDEPDGLNWALPQARPSWNKLSTKGFGTRASGMKIVTFGERIVPASTPTCGERRCDRHLYADLQPQAHHPDQHPGDQGPHHDPPPAAGAGQRLDRRHPGRPDRAGRGGRH